MRARDCIDYLRQVVLLNISNTANNKDENLIRVINEAISVFHNMFTIKIEQAIVLCDGDRQVFEISNKDANVIMASHTKLAKYQLTKSNKNKLELIADIVEEAKANALKQNESIDKNTFTNLGNEVLQILKVESDRAEYRINELNVFAIDQTTLYFPNCKEGEIIYVSYKPKPILVSIEKINDELDLPDTLLECLYAYVALRVVNGVESFKQFYPNLLNTYNQKVSEAIARGAVLPDNMVSTLQYKKGFI